MAATIQLGLGLLFAVVALALREPLQDDLFDGSASLYWILIAAVLAYAASYFARGYLAGHRRFTLYGGLVLMESISRFLFALAVTVGVAEGQTAVALGMAAAPIVSLGVVVPALTRHLTSAGARAGARRTTPPPADTPGEAEFTLAHGTGFALAVLAIMLAEQTFLNAGPLLVRATEGDRGAALAGFAFNVLLLARAPLVLFQAIQTSILPHLTRLWVGAADDGDVDPFRRSVNLTLIAIGVFAGSVALVMAVAGPCAHGRRLRRRLRLRPRRARARVRSRWASTCPRPRSTRRCSLRAAPARRRRAGWAAPSASSCSSSCRPSTTRCCRSRSRCSAPPRAFARCCTRCTVAPDLCRSSW